jgi:D-beta-D-heptose 7-phosphate kinase/D-beta-D-heptose 1-phosphate adenosyltransferase
MKATNGSTLTIIKHIVSGMPGFEHRYIPEYAHLSRAVKILKDAGYRIVLTQGVYDLFHVGHKRYLEDAKKHGDILIVGVDTDELTRKRKGPKRPFDKLEDRLEILSSLRAVDIITIRRDTDHMYRLIKLVQPHVLVMSQTTTDFTDQDKKNLLRYCEDIKVVPAKASTTTTAKLRKVMVDGAEQLGKRVSALIDEYLRGINGEDSSSILSGNPSGTSKFLRKSKTGRPLRPGKKLS